jgi:hypothetical protein
MNHFLSVLLNCEAKPGMQVQYFIKISNFRKYLHWQDN